MARAQRSARSGLGSLPHHEFFVFAEFLHIEITMLLDQEYKVSRSSCLSNSRIPTSSLATEKTAPLDPMNRPAHFGDVDPINPCTSSRFHFPQHGLSRLSIRDYFPLQPFGLSANGGAATPLLDGILLLTMYRSAVLPIRFLYASAPEEGDEFGRGVACRGLTQDLTGFGIEGGV